MIFCSGRRLNKNFSDEQPSQELNLNAQTALPTSAEQQTACVAENAYQSTEQKSIEEMDTELLLIAQLDVEQHKSEQLPIREIHLEQQATLPLVSLQSMLKRPSKERNISGQKMQDEKTRQSKDHVGEDVID